LVALIDEADAAMALARKWYAGRSGRTFYAQRTDLAADGSRLTVRLHTFLTGWRYVDHINGNGLDNRRANLREAEHRQNLMNQRRPRHNTSGFKGVTLNKRTGKWEAQILPQGRHIRLGSFEDPEEAARAYDAAALLHFGEFARPNSPTPADIGDPIRWPPSPPPPRRTRPPSRTWTVPTRQPCRGSRRWSPARSPWARPPTTRSCVTRSTSAPTGSGPARATGWSSAASRPRSTRPPSSTPSPPPRPGPRTCALRSWTRGSSWTRRSTTTWSRRCSREHGGQAGRPGTRQARPDLAVEQRPAERPRPCRHQDRGRQRALPLRIHRGRAPPRHGALHRARPSRHRHHPRPARPVEGQAGRHGDADRRPSRHPPRF